MTEEIFDVCDAQDRVIGQAPRSLVHARRLLHRAVHIWVFNTAGELLVHKRSATKDEYPLRFTSSASGHLAAGEDYLSAAYRELGEELSLAGALEYLTQLPGGPQTAFEHTWLYRLVTDETPRFDPAEILSLHWFSLPELKEFVDRSPEEFTPPFQQLAAWYFRSMEGMAG